MSDSPLDPYVISAGMGSADPDTRIAAATRMGASDSPKCASWLWTMMHYDESNEVRNAARSAFEQLADDVAVPQLEYAACFPDPQGRAAAIKLLGRRRA